MAASNPIAPTGGYNHCQFDYWSPKTDDTELSFLTAGVSGTAFASIDPVNEAIKADLINEFTAATGVTIDGVLLKDGGLTLASHIVFDITPFSIKADTSDAADNSALTLTGAGSATYTRGAYIALFGNEHATDPGQLVLLAGDIAGGTITIETTATEPIKFYTDNTRRWDITSEGNIVPYVDGTYDIGSSANQVDVIFSQELRSHDTDLVIRTIGANGISFYTSNTEQWGINSGGTFYSLNGDNIGSPSLACGIIYAGQLRRDDGNPLVISTWDDQDVQFYTNENLRWYLDDSADGDLIPNAAQDIGTALKPVGKIYTNDLEVTNMDHYCVSVTNFDNVTITDTAQDILDQDNLTSETYTESSANNIALTQSNGRVTLTNAGTYFVRAEVRVLYNIANWVELYVTKNGTRQASVKHEPATGDMQILVLECLVEATAAQYLNFLIDGEDGSSGFLAPNINVLIYKLLGT